MAILDEKWAVLKPCLLIILIGIFMLSLVLVKADLESEILVNLKLSDSFYQVLPGETITVETEIILLREVREDKVVDLLIEYFLINSTDSTIFKLSETKGTILSSHSVREFPIPNGLNPGLYKIMVRVSYDDYSRDDSELFEIISPEDAEGSKLEKLQNEKNGMITESWKKSIIIIVLLTIFLIFIVIIYFEHKKFKQTGSLLAEISKKNLSENNFIKQNKKR